MLAGQRQRSLFILPTTSKGKVSLGSSAIDHAALNKKVPDMMIVRRKWRAILKRLPSSSQTWQWNIFLFMVVEWEKQLFLWRILYGFFIAMFD